MSIAVGLGLMEFPFSGMQGYWRWVDLCEAGGVDSMWQTDRLLSREPMLECMTAMAALAGRTRRLKFGMNVVSLAMRDPVLVAKQCATIDVLSEGRLLPAFGIGSPRGAGMGGAASRHQDARPQDRRGAGDRAPPVAGGQRRLRRRALPPVRRDHLAEAGAGQPADVDRRRRRRRRSGARRASARAGRAAPRRRRRPARVVAAIRAALAETGRSIDDDHYGASFPFHFGRAGDPAVQRAHGGLQQAHGPRRRRLLRRRRRRHDRRAHRRVRCRRHLQVRPAPGMQAATSAMLAQTRQLIEEVLPQVAARWPKVQR